MNVRLLLRRSFRRDRVFEEGSRWHRYGICDSKLPCQLVYPTQLAYVLEFFVWFSFTRPFQEASDFH